MCGLCEIALGKQDVDSKSWIEKQAIFNNKTILTIEVKKSDRGALHLYLHLSKNGLNHGTPHLATISFKQCLIEIYTTPDVVNTFT